MPSSSHDPTQQLVSWTWTRVLGGSDEGTEHARAESRENNEPASPPAEQHQSSTIAQTQLY